VPNPAGPRSLFSPGWSILPRSGMLPLLTLLTNVSGRSAGGEKKDISSEAFRYRQSRHRSES